MDGVETHLPTALKAANPDAAMMLLNPSPLSLHLWPQLELLRETTVVAERTLELHHVTPVVLTAGAARPTGTSQSADMD
jgi:hypothetical protein